MPNGRPLRRSPLLGTPYRRYLAAPPATLIRTWGNIQEGLTPWGRRLAQGIAPPMELRWRFPQQGPPRAWGYWSPNAPRGQQVALWSGMPGGERTRGEVALHELGHAVQSRTWGGLSPTSEMALSAVLSFTASLGERNLWLSGRRSYRGIRTHSLASNLYPPGAPELVSAVLAWLEWLSCWPGGWWGRGLQRTRTGQAEPSAAANGVVGSVSVS